MPYTALADRRMPYDNDGSVVGQGANGLVTGIQYWLTGSEKIEAQDEDYTIVGTFGAASVTLVNWWFFPETREVTGYYSVMGGGSGGEPGGHVWYGSVDSTNGLDGTWETASLPSGESTSSPNNYAWRSGIKPISLTGAKRVARLKGSASGVGNQIIYLLIAHIYGEKAAGQTANDIIFINHDDTPGVEFTAPEDYGDQPLATTVVRQFRIKNTSGSLTANTINLQCNDADFAISENGTSWVTTINIASLAAGAESATLYSRCTTPAVGALLGPRFNRIVVTVASYT